jgi:hypothetical protein
VTGATRAIIPVDLAGLPVDRDRLYAIRHGVVRAEVSPPQTPIEREAFAETVRGLTVDEGPVPAAHSGAEMGQLLLIMSWFRRNPEEYERTTAYQSWIKPSSRQ